MTSKLHRLNFAKKAGLAIAGVVALTGDLMTYE
jgi:hypothetical protein